jgi:hypothetical protein
MSGQDRNAEVLVVTICAGFFAVLVAVLVAVHFANDLRREPDPYSICEYCGQLLDGTNTVCVREHAEGSSK